MILRFQITSVVTTEISDHDIRRNLRTTYAKCVTLKPYVAEPSPEILGEITITFRFPHTSREFTVGEIIDTTLGHSLG